MQTKFNTLTKKSVQGKTRLLVILLLLAGLSSVVFFNQISSNYARNSAESNYIAPVLDPTLQQPQSFQPEHEIEPILTPQEQAHLEQYLNNLSAGQQIKQQLEKLPELTEAKQQQEVEKLLLQVDDYFDKHFISQNELIFLKLAIMKYSLSPSDYQTYATNLIAHYQQNSQKKWQEYLTHRNPQFINYKQKEKELVERIMQMESFPDGLTREQYLRREIEKLKAEAYGYHKSAEG
jgi:hypothetical protein